MRILRGLFFWFAFAASAVEATPPAPGQPFILSVVPALGPSSGGTTVTITGGFFGLPTGFACLLPCPPKVFFGETLSALEKETDIVLVVKTPPHPAGGVDVTVVTGDSRTATVRGGFLYVDTATAPVIRS
ncbi:MAG: IPT/TIG domain-containing protein, partial [Thermoanaerobaculia bacterium]